MTKKKYKKPKYIIGDTVAISRTIGDENGTRIAIGMAKIKYASMDDDNKWIYRMDVPGGLVSIPESDVVEKLN